MKTKTLLKAFTLALGLLVAQQCYGPFVLTKKIYSWNGRVGDKFVNSAIMWAFIIVPVYSATLFIDFVILNTIQFWTGSNPLAMGEGESETQIVQQDGNTFKITATKNRFDIELVAGAQKGKKFALVFEEASQSWILEQKEQRQVIARVTDPSARIMTLIHPDGKTVDIKL